MPRILLVLAAVALLASCGGHASGSPNALPSSTPPSGTGGPPAPVNSPVTVGVVAGSTASGVNITVGPPASTTPPNAQDLGVAALTGTASAFNVGDTISRNTTQRVVLFGPGLSADMQVMVRGPSDIQIDPQSIVAIRSTDTPPVPGISFTVTVAANAALGARTVVLQASNGDITTFTGGLEVVP